MLSHIFNNLHFFYYEKDIGDWFSKIINQTNFQIQNPLIILTAGFLIHIKTKNQDMSRTHIMILIHNKPLP
jgi:hypothetical protein